MDGIEQAIDAEHGYVGLLGTEALLSPIPCRHTLASVTLSEF